MKQILSVKERREMLRNLAREHMDAVMHAGTAGIHRGKCRPSPALATAVMRTTEFFPECRF